MAQQIVEVVLFYSKSSKASLSCIDFIKQNQFPVMLIPLDTEEDRAAMMNSEVLKVTSVPTLAVSFADGNVKAFVGTEKVISWFRSMMEMRAQHGHEKHGRGQDPRSQHDPRAGNRGNHNGNGRQQPRSDEPEEEEESEEIDEPPPPKKRSVKSTGKKSAGKSKKKQSSKVQPSEIEFMDDGNYPSKPPPPPTAGLLTTPKDTSSNKALMSKAKQMENEFMAAMGEKH